MKKFLSVLSLFGSMSTLLCCALPTFLVGLGMGAAVGGLVSAVPQLIWLSQHKDILFIFCAVMLGIAGFFQWQARKLACPIDPKLAQACTDARGWSFVLYWISVVFFIIGVFFAYLGPRLLFG